MQDKNVPFVSTLSLFGYLLTVLSWEMEVGIVLLHFLTDKRPDPIAHFVLLGLSLTLTVFTYLRGKRDFAMLRGTKGRVPITALQGTLITVFMIAFGATMTFVAIRLFGLLDP